MEAYPIVIEKKFDSTIGAVWKALTDSSEMKKWYFEIPDFKAEVGFTFKFQGQVENRKYTHLCEVTRAEENKAIAYTWKYKGIQGEGLVSFDIEMDEDLVKVVLTHTGVGSFPKNNPDLSWDGFYEGWSYIMGTLLANYLKKKPTKK